MTTIAEFSLPAEEFALRDVLDSLPEIGIEVERVAAYDPDCVMPYVWFSGPSADSLATLDDRLEADPSVDTIELLTDLGDERLYRMEWLDAVTVMVFVLTEEDATVLEAAGEGSTWDLQVLFPERESLSRTYEFAIEKGLSIEIGKIHDLADTRMGRYDLTDAQRETLVAALEGGYYEIPRDADMAALSDELGISNQALSERLRRAHRVLVEEAVSIGTDER